MGQLEDLTASLDAIDTKLDGVREGVTAVDTEVKELIALIGQTPAPDLSAVLAKAQALQTEVDELGAQVKAIPPKPTT